MFSVITEKIMWGDLELSIESGKVARQADGAIVVRFGKTTVLCTVVYEKKQAENANFFPLTINYQEKFYASGRIPGGFMRREGKPLDREVLISRLIDRPIRPLFPDGFLNTVQVVCTVLSYDLAADPEIAALIGASAALSISGVPFDGPIAGCKVEYSSEGEFLLNSISAQESRLTLIVAGTKDGILMVESEANELSEEIMLEAVMFGFEAFQPVIQMIDRLKQKISKEIQVVVSFEEKYNKELLEIEELSVDLLRQALAIASKSERKKQIENIKISILENFKETSSVVLEILFENILAKTMRQELLRTKKRIDGRALDQVRKIDCEIDYLPKVHGSALFTRGDTQAIVVVTLGSGSDEQIIDDIVNDRKEYFMLHYNFPSYSVGEIGRMGAPGRREIGHGKLAWRALRHMLPSKQNFQYTIRIVSDITESDGSSSMATVCGASLAMMSAGIPMKNSVAGIAMGLIKEGNEYIVLSDILGDEDHLGDMDFKVVGTKNGITALQMDIKINSISKEIIRDALAQAHIGRMHILDIMNQTICQARIEVNESAPRIESILINKDRIRDLIGPGGKIIKEICERTCSKIEVDDSGVVSIFSSDKKNLDEALVAVKNVCCPPDIGSIFVGKVMKITDFGAFVSIGNKEGLVHISNISEKRLKSVDEVLTQGQEVRVKVLDIDDKNRIKLTMKI